MLCCTLGAIKNKTKIQVDHFIFLLFCFLLCFYAIRFISMVVMKGIIFTCVIYAVTIYETNQKQWLAIIIYWNGFLALSIFHSNNSSEDRGCSGGMESILQRKSAYVPWLLPKYHNIEYMLDNNQKRASVDEISSPSEENITTITPVLGIQG